jgi:hypothetical protein
MKNIFSEGQASLGKQILAGRASYLNIDVLEVSPHIDRLILDGEKQNLQYASET